MLVDSTKEGSAVDIMSLNFRKEFDHIFTHMFVLIVEFIVDSQTVPMKL